jgi:hypothetical protein
MRWRNIPRFPVIWPIFTPEDIFAALCLSSLRRNIYKSWEAIQLICSTSIARSERRLVFATKKKVVEVTSVQWSNKLGSSCRDQGARDLR